MTLDDPDATRAVLRHSRARMSAWALYMVFYAADSNSPTGARLVALVGNALGVALRLISC